MNKDAIKNIHNHILKIASMERAETALWFFKTGKGEYGEGDKFLGLTVPQTRKLARAYSDITLKETEELLHSEFHDERLLALIILNNKFEKTESPNFNKEVETQQEIRKEIFDLYLKNIKKKINNWDLVDTSAPKIVGGYLSGLKNKNEIKDILLKLSESENIWENRVAVISTFYFIVKENNYKYTIELVKKLLTHEHDLIQKANGWMMREIFKRIDQDVIRDFIKKNYKNIPRTTLRYSIEKMHEEERKRYLKGEF